MVEKTYLDPFERLLAALFPPERIRAIETGRAPAGQWAELARSGFLDALVPEAVGGAGLSLREVCPLLIALGRHAVPLPVGETMIARALLARSGAAPEEGPIAFAGAGGLVTGGLVADAVLVQGDDNLSLLDRSQAALIPTGIHGSLDGWLGDLPTGGIPLAAPDCGLEAIAALVRAAAIAGAADRLLSMSVGYACERVQFGKPIGRQQALQQQLAVMAEDCAAVRLAVELACDADLWPLPEAVAAAKSVASAAAPRIAAAAHGVHGAIGISAEFDLQLYTRRLQAWRLADGAESYWNRRLGAQVLASADDSIVWVRRRIFPEPIGE